MDKIQKYPRTRHIEGSRFQPGDEDLEAVPFSILQSRYLVVEEKMDGANSGISFSKDGKLLLQSRGHYLRGGPREKHFELFKTWAHTFAGPLREVLGDRYIMYGEWMYAKHTIFYTNLPHYFLEFDLYDRQKEVFLSTERRREILGDLPFLKSVRVLAEGEIESRHELEELVGPSPFIDADHMALLKEECRCRNIEWERARRETDPSEFMEGLYIKVESEGVVKERYKWVRADFLTTALDSDSHWLSRPIIPNQLASGVDLFAWGKGG